MSTPTLKFEQRIRPGAKNEQIKIKWGLSNIGQILLNGKRAQLGSLHLSDNFSVVIWEIAAFMQNLLQN